MTGETWSGSSFESGVLTRTFEFTYGSPFTIQSDLNVQGQDGGLALFGSTIVADFLLPAGATLVADSGALYSPIATAVPEPPVVLLTFLGGLAAFVLKRRRTAGIAT